MKKIAMTLIVAGACAFAAAPASYNTCKGCHGAAGEKNTMVPQSKPNSMTKAEVKASLEGYKAGTLNKYGKAMMMKGQVARLTPEQIDELANYIGK
jgi:cytochrome c